jgi:hypothetical protein
VDNKYRVTRGDPVADRERILDLWARCEFGSGEQASERYDWFYLRNPRGQGRVYLLWQADELVGALGAGSRQFTCAAGEPPLAVLRAPFRPPPVFAPNPCPFSCRCGAVPRERAGPHANVAVDLEAWLPARRAAALRSGRPWTSPRR